MNRLLRQGALLAFAAIAGSAGAQDAIERPPPPGYPIAQPVRKARGDPVGVQATVVDGVSMKVWKDAPVAPTSTPPAGLVEQVMPDGSRMRMLPDTLAAPAARRSSASTAFRIVDIDPAGRTADPADAQRLDVRFRRVDRLP